MIEGSWLVVCDGCERELGPYHTESEAIASVAALGWLPLLGPLVLCNLCKEKEERKR